MAPAAFLDTVPGSGPTADQRLRFVEPVISQEINSKRKLARILNKSMKSVLKVAAADTLRVVNTASHKARGGDNRQKNTLNDIGLYLNTPALRSMPLPEQDACDLGRQSWHWVAVPVKIEWSATPVDTEPIEFSMNGISTPASAESHSSTAPFAPAQDKVIHDMPDEEIILGQFAEYQLSVFIYQHRCFLYGIYVRKEGARMIYWDRAGARVSEEFDWTGDDSFLLIFIWKLAHMSLEQLGFDPTAELATDAEYAELQGAKGDRTLPPHVMEVVRNAFDRNYPIYRLRINVGEPFSEEAFPARNPVKVPTDPLSTSHSNPATPLEHQTKTAYYFLVARPHFCTDALIGRCTKCYIAYDLEGKRFCFLKDYWRSPNTKHARPEHLVYERLRSARTPFIATLICGGDVGGPRSQKTCMQDNLPSKNRPAPRVHYRIAIAEIGKPLKTFNGFRHLANIFGQTLFAHAHAVKYAGVLHRDISVSNIMINADGDGFLIDWDLSRLISELSTGPCEPDRAGTWQFQSALLLKWPREPYHVSDDIESFIHAFRYMVLRHHVTSLINLPAHIDHYFNCHAFAPAVSPDGIRTVKRGGDYKLTLFRSPSSPFIVPGSPKLQALLDNIARGCYESYDAVDRGRMNSHYGVRTYVPEKQRAQPRPAPPASTFRPVSSVWLTRSRTKSPTPPSAPPPPPTDADPCQLSGFLTDANAVIRVFVAYIADTMSQEDQEANVLSKAADEFERREEECLRARLLARLADRARAQRDSDSSSARSTSYNDSGTSDDTDSESDSTSSDSGPTEPEPESVAPTSDAPSRPGSLLSGAL